MNQELLGSSRHSSEEAIPGLYVSETLLFPETKMKRRTASISSQSETRDSEHKPFFKRNSDTLVSAKDFSVGERSYWFYVLDRKCLKISPVPEACKMFI